ncbi:hypothetical protein AM493_20225 [Flavobacterium akiainvivens]|uniref:Uncharacterized protein n=1 Tax=Flavobacterium akiainvivens TaxID=1202724 RepID=A0A0M9VJU1_9FLAO|nr:hypothetical protein [Flavobacterium akiainvivens]KOS08112.1 hypothetical protein AM493_20225 [Flavobacterium akiainvivens]SFQ72007.1 hypothetical protein SAMN05444144_11753 [Flavobacterium akiainvivens]
MKRLLLKGNSKEDIKLIANFATRLGLTVQYLEDEITYTVQEPEMVTEWDNLSTAQRQGIYDALEDIKANGGKSHNDVMKQMRSRYE